MLLIAFSQEALRRRTMAVELDHQLLTQANRLDERVLGGPVPRFPLVSSRRGRSKQQGIGRWIVAIGRWTENVDAGSWLRRR